MHVCVPLHATPPSAPCPPPVSGADDIGTEESDDKCPLSGNKADDKWAGAQAAPLRCNNRRWMASCPPTLPPLPPVPVMGAHPAPPAQEGAKSPAWAPITAGQDTQAMKPGSPRGCPWQRNKAVHTAEAGDSLGSRLPAARICSCAHTCPAHTPSTCVLALCTCSSCLGTTPPLQVHRYMLLCHAWAHICHPDLVHTHQHKAMHTHAPAHLYALNMSAHAWIWDYVHMQAEMLARGHKPLYTSLCTQFRASKHTHTHMQKIQMHQQIPTKGLHVGWVLWSYNDEYDTIPVF